MIYTYSDVLWACDIASERIGVCDNRHKVGGFFDQSFHSSTGFTWRVYHSSDYSGIVWWRRD